MLKYIRTGLLIGHVQECGQKLSGNLCRVHYCTWGLNRAWLVHTGVHWYALIQNYAYMLLEIISHIISHLNTCTGYRDSKQLSKHHTMPYDTSFISSGCDLASFSVALNEASTAMTSFCARSPYMHSVSSNWVRYFNCSKRISMIKLCAELIRSQTLMQSLRYSGVFAFTFACSSFSASAVPNGAMSSSPLACRWVPWYKCWKNMFEESGNIKENA